MSGGMEWLVDAFGCDPLRLASPAALCALSQSVIARLGLRVLGAPVVHQFPSPAGVTGLYLLSESHWAWHTYPESELATFNLYCCRAQPPLDWPGLLAAALGARRVEVTSVQRGLGAEHRPAALHPAALHPAALHPAALHPAALHPAAQPLAEPAQPLARAWAQPGSGK